MWWAWLQINLGSIWNKDLSKAEIAPLSLTPEQWRWLSRSVMWKLIFWKSLNIHWQRRNKKWLFSVGDLGTELGHSGWSYANKYLTCWHNHSIFIGAYMWVWPLQPTNTPLAFAALSPGMTDVTSFTQSKTSIAERLPPQAPCSPVIQLPICVWGKMGLFFQQ